MTATSPPVTWLTNNYVHESWDHLLKNLGGYFVCTLIYIALIPVLAVLGFDPRWVKRFSVVTHLAALTVIPIISSFACLQLVLSRAPQLYLLGFSSSVENPRRLYATTPYSRVRCSLGGNHGRGLKRE
jgi:hypothetical protein